jgi:redox-sensitive bicupin YhaK (pirin superfamily)
MGSFELIPARPRDIGGDERLAVRRTLPSMKRRMVGPFIFWDHMGPARFEPGHGADVRPHPHIELATVTYLFEGAIVHKDSLGSDQEIRPGDLNWMTAGRGIVHSERSSPEIRKRGSTVHAIQSWVALPVAQELVDPSFQHVPAGMLPEFELEGSVVRVLAGSAYGEDSPVRVESPMFYAEARLDAGAELALPAADEHAERAVYVVEGSIECHGEHGERVDAGTMAVAATAADVAIRALGPARVMLLGGAHLDGERHIWWNFVSSSRERIERAKHDWKEMRFPKIPGDDSEFVPLPE